MMIKCNFRQEGCTEHHSFWLRPDTMEYIRLANQATRIPQGQILQIIVDYFRLTRKKASRPLTESESDHYEAVKCMLRVIPL